MFRLLPSAWLLMVQLLILLMTFLSSTNASIYRFSVWGLGMITLLIVGKVIKETVIFKVFGHLFIVGALFFSFLMIIGFDQPYIQICSHICEIGAYICAIYGLLRYMFADRYLTKDELFAAGAVFTLLAWTFAYAYNICQLIFPNSFINTVHAQSIQSWLDILFFSFSLQSATGLSNLTPVLPAVKALSILQMFVGVMYLTIIVSRLVALHYISHLPKHKE
ncbi:ion channel [Acinetobacter sp. HY1485]|uniref:ion channel n=1 Tax=Acinetobacter sp. HY1485 TaxID=2970918 RepID=UPI0022B9AAAA|nr:ion channel [Acinetobacter sp. HY1485]